HVAVACHLESLRANTVGLCCNFQLASSLLQSAHCEGDILRPLIACQLRIGCNSLLVRKCCLNLRTARAPLQQRHLESDGKVLALQRSTISVIECRRRLIVSHAGGDGCG